MADAYDEDTGEITAPGQSLSVIDSTALATIARVEIDTQITTARQYPRSVDRAIKNIIALATLDEETAEECCYALVRKSKRRGRSDAEGDEENKPIEGPSIRLAEIAFSCWGNCRVDARVIEVNRTEKYVAAEAVFHDLETNAAQKSVVRRRISTKHGHLFSDDMIIVTGNAACAIAKRNAILAGIPKGVTRPGYAKARAIIAGTAETLTINRKKAIDAFARFAVTPAQIFEALAVEGEGDIKTTHIATLRAMFSTLKNGESTVEEMFGKPEADHKIVQNPLADDAPANEASTAAKAQPDHGTGDTRAVDEGGAHRSGHAAGPQPAAVRDSAPPNEPSTAAKPSADFRGASSTVDGSGSATAEANAATKHWREEGRKAARAGMSARTLPGELRQTGREADAEAWRTGHAEETAKRGAA